MKNRFRTASFTLGLWLSLHPLSHAQTQGPLPLWPHRPQPPAPVPQRVPPPACGTYGGMPLGFEPNEGQTDPQAGFISRGPGYTLFLTPREAVLALIRWVPSTKFPPHPKGKSLPSAPRICALRLKWAGTSSDPVLEGQEKLPGTSNYFIGRDPSRWRTRIPQYARVHVPEAYPGVDMDYYGNQGRLEYDFTVKPGADAGAIRLSFEGAEGAVLGNDGELLLKTGFGDVPFRAPSLYQTEGGVRKPVQGHYKWTGPMQVGFEVGSYDRTKPLVIDPVLDYSTYVGGNNHTGFMAIAVDSQGNAYTTGHSLDVNFPTTSGVLQSTNPNGYPDAVVCKINPTGTALVYSTYLGGQSNDLNDQPYGLAVDGSGDCYVSGLTGTEQGADDFPVTDVYSGNGQPYQAALAGLEDAYFAELNPTGSGLLYSTFLGGVNGGNGYSESYALALDPSDGVYITGWTNCADFPTTSGAAKTTLGNAIQNAFIAKFNPTASTGQASLVYSTLLGGSQSNDIDNGYGIGVDGSGDAYVTGITYSGDFPATSGAAQSTLTNGDGTAFVTKLDPAGTAWLYSTFLGGSGSLDGDQGNAIAVDGAGDAYVTGQAGDSNFPTTPGAFQTVYGGGPYDAFLTKVNPAGTAWLYSTFLGGGGLDSAFCIAVDPSGNAYIGGGTESGLGSSDFPLTSDAFQSVNGSTSSDDGFVSELTPAGGGASDLVYSTYFGGGDDTIVYGIAADGQGDIYFAGESRSGYDGTAQIPIFPSPSMTPGPIQAAYGGAPYGNGFVGKFGPSPTSTGTPEPSPTATPAPGTPVPVSPPGLYPNPALGPGFTLVYSLPQNAQSVGVKVFTTAFRRVFQDASLPASAGSHHYFLNAQTLGLADGLYYVVVDIGANGSDDRFILKELVLR